MSESQQWYYAKDGNQLGPVAEERLQEMAKSGQLRPDDLVWHAGLGAEWVSSGSIPSLFSQAQGAPSAQASQHLPPSNGEITKMALGFLEGRWASVVGIHLVWLGVVFGSIMALGILLGIVEQIAGKSLLLALGTQLTTKIVQAPFTFSFSFLSLRISRGLPAGVPMVFEGFAHFWKTCATHFLIFLFVILWMVLLIVPGIVAGLSYSMAWYILCDDPALSPMEALRRSKAMMQGHKWRYFCLLCRFFGWGVLCVFTLGVGFLWFLPYLGTSVACFYNDLKGRTDVPAAAQPISI
jgi:uncharacterized membrane protein